jgi:uncharacterized protein YecT (DUF1311 family)
MQWFGPTLFFPALTLLMLSAPAILGASARAEDAPPIDPEGICQHAKTLVLPKPTAAPDKGCDSQALYYGIGRPADFSAARACALAHLTGTDSPMDGPAILANIYANGSGVPRDYDKAIAYACQIDAAPAEMEGRIAHLVALKAKGPGTTPFDVCDDITSGLMMGFCASRDSDIAAAKREAKIDALARDLGEGHKAALKTLRAAAGAYANAVADNEVDLSGTARGALSIGARDEANDAFATTLQAALAGELAAATPADLAAADKALNAAYAKVMALKDMSGLGTVDKAGIKKTQRAWLAYRDAFTAFAKGGRTSPTTVARVLTAQRTKALAAFLE